MIESSCKSRSNGGVVFYGNFFLTYELIMSCVFLPYPDLIYTLDSSMSFYVNLVVLKLSIILSTFESDVLSLIGLLMILFLSSLQARHIAPPQT